MCSNDDFLNWSDVDLDTVLIDYTDDDFFTTDDTSTDSSDEMYIKPAEPLSATRPKPMDSVAQLKRNKTKTVRRPYVYRCPVCSKELRSPSGFRGHVIKQHPTYKRASFKVGDHRVVHAPVNSEDKDNAATLEQSSSRVSNEESASFSSVTDVSLPDEQFATTLTSCNCRAWTAISHDPLYRLPVAKYGQEIIRTAEHITEECDTALPSKIAFAIKTVFVSKSVTTESERESLMTEVNDLRMNTELETEFINYINTCVTFCQFQVSKFLYQIWLRHLVSELLSSIHEICKKKESSVDDLEPLSSTDQNILYYVCGYMARKVKLVSMKNKKKFKDVDNVVDCLTTNKPVDSNHFVDKYRKWAELQSRGGLLFAKPNFYLLIREFDSLYRKRVKKSGIRTALANKCLLQSDLFDGFMVKYYWTKILEEAHEHEERSLPVLDYLINLFITIKGFCVAKTEKNRLLTKNVNRPKSKQSSRSSKSLRGKLKGKHCISK